MTRLRSLVFVLAAVAAGPLAAQAPDPLARGADSVFAPWSRTDTPGCAVGVDRGGAPLLRRAWGMANLETGTPWTPGTISESGSVAKQFVAAAVVLLALDGKLTLDEDVTRWLPELRGIARPISARQLLNHTSGLPDRYFLHAAEGRSAGVVDHDNAEVMEVVSRLRELNFPPGDDYLYSNTGYVAAATLVERVSGMSLQAFSEARIFRPLGMQARWREDHRVVVPGRAAAYTGTRSQGFRNDHPFTRVHGSGGLLVTVDDFLRWERALQRGDGVWGAVRDSLERRSRLNDGTEIVYGLGVNAGSRRGLRAITHTGATGGYRAALQRYPERDLAVALLCNAGAANPGQLASAVADLALGLLPEPPQPPAAVAVDPAALAALAGWYRSERTGESLRLLVREGQLVATGSSGGQGGTPLVPVGPGRFRPRSGDETYTVLAGAGGAPGMRVEAPNARAVEYRRMPPPRSGAAAIAGYTGTYRSPELGAELRLSAAGDTLFLTVPRAPRPLRLEPLFEDGFALAGESERIRFERDPRGRITGLAIWAGRVRHLRFERVR